MEWLKRIIRRLLGRPEPKPEELVQEYIEDVKRVRRPPRQRGRGIRSTDLGMRKLSRHRGGRLHERRSGVDHNLTMEDADKKGAPPKRKKKTWFEDRNKNG